MKSIADWLSSQGSKSRLAGRRVAAECGSLLLGDHGDYQKGRGIGLMFWTKKKEVEAKKEPAPEVSTRRGIKAKLHYDDERDPSQEQIDYVDYLLSIVDKDIAEAYGKLYYSQISPLNLILTQISLKLGDFCAAMEKTNAQIEDTDNRQESGCDGDNERQPGTRF